MRFIRLLGNFAGWLLLLALVVALLPFMAISIVWRIFEPLRVWVARPVVLLLERWVYR